MRVQVPLAAPCSNINTQKKERKMIYLYKSDLTRAKEMNQKCREAGVIALDCEGNDSDMYGWPDTFYLIAACFVFRLTIMQPSLRLLRKTIIEKKRNSL